MCALPSALPTGRRRCFRAASGRVWPRCHRPGRRPTPCPAPQRPGGSPRTPRSRGERLRAQRDQSTRSLRGVGGAQALGSRPAARGAQAAGASDPRPRRSAAGRGPRGFVGGARVPLRGDPFGTQPSERDRGVPGGPARGGRRRAGGSGGRRRLRWTTSDPTGRGEGVSASPSPAVPVPLPQGSGQGGLRG